MWKQCPLRPKWLLLKQLKVRMNVQKICEMSVWSILTRRAQQPFLAMKNITGNSNGVIANDESTWKSEKLTVQCPKTLFYWVTFDGPCIFLEWATTVRLTKYGLLEILTGRSSWKWTSAPLIRTLQHLHNFCNNSSQDHRTVTDIFYCWLELFHWIWLSSVAFSLNASPVKVILRHV